MKVTNYLLTLSLIISCILNAQLHAATTIMIDPAGDARTTGRIIGDSFERAVTLDLALALKKALEADGYSVLITRSTGQTVLPLQNANFANRLHPDLYISLHCYDNPDQKFAISLYTMSRAEPFIAAVPELSLLPIHKAHWPAHRDTEKIGNAIHETLLQLYGHQFLMSLIVGLPLAPLIGIQSPAISIELNCHSSADSNQYIQPLVDALKAALPS